MNFSDLSVRKDLPYPEPVIPYPNPVEAKKLMNDYGGRDSETTAILQYVYQSYVLSREFPEFSKKLAEIAACEMKHQKNPRDGDCGLRKFPRYRRQDGVLERQLRQLRNRPY